jgi:lactate permease
MLALFPFMLVVYLLLVRDIRTDVVLLLAYLFTATSLLFAWDTSLLDVVFASVKGMLLAVDVILIITGILLVFSLLEKRSYLKHLEDFFMRISSEVHIHIILMGFFLVMFLEGIAGFGIPALIVAPLLVLVGVNKLPAIVITLFSDSIAVVFGAFGTPFVVGFAEVSSLSSAVFATGLISGIFMLFTPSILLVLHALLEHKQLSSIRSYIPIALLSGLVSSVVFISTAWLLGPELPSVLAAVIGMVIIVSLLRTHLFAVRIKKPAIKKALPALGAYGLIILVLLASRLDVFGFGSLLTSLSFTLSTQDFSHVFSAYHPGVLILACFVILLVAIRPNKQEFFSVFSEVKKKSLPVIITLLFTLMFVQLVISSPDPSIPFLLAQSFSSTGSWYVLFASLLGAFGSFVAGSATVSNLMLFSLHLDAAALSGLSESLVLSAQAVGAGAGNMIAIHNVLAVLAVVHIQGGMRKVLRINAVLAILLCLVASLLLFVFSTLGIV